MVEIPSSTAYFCMLGDIPVLAQRDRLMVDMVSSQSRKSNVLGLSRGQDLRSTQKLPSGGVSSQSLVSSVGHHQHLLFVRKKLVGAQKGEKVSVIECGKALLQR